MANFQLVEVRIMDSGINTPESFIVDPSIGYQDFFRLISDLLLMTRPTEKQGEFDGVVFDDIQPLIEDAAQRMSRRVDEIAENLGVVETAGRKTWVRRMDEPTARTPTPEEVGEFEGESRLLYDSMAGVGAAHASRLFAAWGVYCCERALREMRSDRRVMEIAALVGSAGTLLGHANWCSGFHAVKEQERFKRRKGALSKLSNDPAQAAKRLAEELWPQANRHGWTADKLHEEIAKRGQYASSGRVAKWLTNLRKTGRC